VAFYSIAIIFIAFSNGTFPIHTSWVFADIRTRIAFALWTTPVNLATVLPRTILLRATILRLDAAIPVMSLVVVGWKKVHMLDHEHVGVVMRIFVPFSLSTKPNPRVSVLGTTKVLTTTSYELHHRRP